MIKEFKTFALNSSGRAGSACLFLVVLSLANGSQNAFAEAKASSISTNNMAGMVITIEGTVEVTHAGGAQWSTADTNATLAFGDGLRTGPHSRATIRLSDLSVLRVNEKTTLEIRPQNEGRGSILDLQSGSSYFFNRSKPSSMQFRTPLISGAIRGTEFNLTAIDNGATTVTLLEGEVALNNDKGDLVLQSGEQGTVDPGQAPRKTAMLQAINIIQWSLYYPAVVNPDDLGLTSDEKSNLAESLTAYRSGNLLGALEKYPKEHRPGSDADRLQYAALLLSVGQVEQTEAVLASLNGSSRPANALRTIIAAVKHEEILANEAPVTASEWLAQSYYLQSRSHLNEALDAANAAVKAVPGFGFAWVRVAELEFGLGRVDKSKTALDRGLQLSPNNAQALALKGFLLAAENRIGDATAAFDQAIATDGALANAWLGRGLCEIRKGDYEKGRQDLQVAATLEPNRSDLRSYLGKAWNTTHDRKHADKELRLAKQLDPSDPTPWLYSAIMAHDYNEDNQAVTDLEKSKELNNNRSVYRSKFLLDQDQAVRSANLAKMYADVGMFDVSVHEAARAVDYDYANYSAHLFLANSYDALRDPRQVNLRYETPWFSQLLVADLLAPVGSVPLSQNVSQQEYSRLFEGDHIGLYTDTEYLSRGTWVQSASQYGNVDKTGFAFDEYYRSQNGDRPNNDLESFNFSARFKQQLTLDDSLFLEVNYSDYSSGDVLQYYNQNAASSTLRITETQVPNIFVGYHREWNPGIHTLFLVGRLQDTFTANDPANQLFVVSHTGPNVTAVNQVPSVLSYKSELTAYSAELQQIFQSDKQTLVLGIRGQSGDIDTHSFVQRSLVPNPPTFDTSITPDLTRLSAYTYYTYKVVDPFLVTAGVSFDHLKYPVNNEIAPVSSGEAKRDRISPKLGFRWTPLNDTTVRGEWTRSLGGVFYDTSVRLEPTEIAGFNQAFRSVIPESVAGLVPGSKFETFGLALDQRFESHTYFSIVGEVLNSLGNRSIGVQDSFGPFNNTPGLVDQSLDFQERTLALNVNQLLGDGFALGATFRLSEGYLKDRVPEIPSAQSGNFSLSANRNVHATLEQANLYALYNHPCGFFARGEAIWSGQSNGGYAVALPGDSFWQFNLFAGYRLPRRLAELQVGVLDIGNRNYNLNPLNLYSELPRSRTFVASFKFNF